MKKLLVVDDDAMFRHVMKHHLSQLGFTAIENDSALHLYQQIREESPAACFIDIVMEGKDGIETILELKEKSQCPKLIAVSSNVMYLDWVSEFGVDAILIKPVSLQAVKQVLDKLEIHAV
ncbi:response regulator [Methylomonas sp. EFPC3]|uniref:response regulator n=1 Tax=Methylomonas TaxID=416 RepID=UPI0011274608|nr:MULTISPECIES: response regulator [Methylomonas]TPQ28717.1 hypothetical protein C2U68_04505 [Methylomonas koyamae]WFP51444.1 response regulator [Methylomonas sp. EFPC3]